MATKMTSEQSPLLNFVTTPNNNIYTQSRNWRKGLFLAFLSGVTFTANNFLIQYYQVDSLELLLVRSIVQSIVLGVLASNLRREFNYEDETTVKVSAFIQAVSGAMRLYFNFSCLAYLNLGDALTLIFSEPLFTVCLSFLMLKASASIWKLMFCAALIAGMILNIQPPFLFPTLSQNTTITDHYHNEDFYYGVALALACAVCGSLCNMFISFCGSVNSLNLVFYTGLAGVFLSVVGCCLQESNRILFNMEALDTVEWLWLFVISGVGVLAYLFMTEALKAVSPTSVSVMRALEIVMAYGVQVAVVGQWPSVLSASGAALVMLAVVGIAMEEKFVQDDVAMPEMSVGNSLSLHV